MNRESINPVEWGLQFGLDQGEVISGATRTLHCSGQVAVRPDPDADFGVAVVSPGEIRGQMECALANLDDVLREAGMSRSNIINLRFYTTDMDGFLENYDAYAGWIADAGIRPPQTLLGIDRLFHPEVLVEVEAVAAE
jgi:enamine deaminase RidA (YjgF/YER057c/UK114 family)